MPRNQVHATLNSISEQDLLRGRQVWTLTKIREEFGTLTPDEVVAVYIALYPESAALEKDELYEWASAAEWTDVRPQ